MSTVIHQCEKALFPFTVKPEDWRELCLSVAVDQKVRVVRRDSSSANNDAAAAVPYHWCVAQTEDGALGLLPSLVLQRAGEDESFALSPVVSPSKDVPVHALKARSQAPSRHVDPFVFDLSVEDDDAEELWGGDNSDPAARRTTARPGDLPRRVCSPNNGSQVVVSSSTSSTPSDSDDNDSVRSFEQCPAVLGVQSAPLRIMRRSTRVSAATAAAARKKSLTTSGKWAPPVPAPTPASPETFHKSKKSQKTKKGATAKAEAEAEELRQLQEEWGRVIAETAWMQTEVQSRIAAATTKAKDEYAQVKQEAQLKTAQAERKRSAAAALFAKQHGLATEAQALLAELEALKAPDASAAPTATIASTPHSSTTIGRRLFDAVDPNTASHGVSTTSAEKTVLDLVNQETDTLASYTAQEAKLHARLARATTLLETLHKESALLRVSEDALEALLMPGVDYEVEDIPNAAKDAAPVRVVMNPSRAASFPWPRALPGLTEEEQTALDNYVRLADKYDAKRRHESGRFGELLDMDDVEEGSLSPNHAVAKLRETVANGDAQVAKLKDDVAQLRAFLATYEPVAEQIQEQIAIGTRVLKHKESDIKKLQHERASGVPL